jgi:SAM-dependent methyltransferase
MNRDTALNIVLSHLRPVIGFPLLVCWGIGLYRPEDRRVLEDIIIPCYQKDPAIQRILIVGVNRPGRHYPSLFAGKICLSIDLDHKRARYGAAQHIIDHIENLGHHIEPESLDLILMNGMIGWGINDQAALESVIETCHRHLCPGGSLLLSTDASRSGHGSLSEVRTLQEGFYATPLKPFGACSAVAAVPWHPKPEHVFYFFKKRGAKVRSSFHKSSE